MFTKKLMHDIITFCNNYIDNDNILITIAKYPTHLNVSIDVWTLDKDKYIDKHIDNISKSIHNEVEFIKYKQKVLEELPKSLKQLK